MQRLLIVEDNKTLANLIAKKISIELDLEIDIAYTFAEAKLFMAGYNYFLTLLDINLPDAPNGEIVDYALERKNHVIVLSANIDKEFRRSVLQRNIIDYVVKSGVNDIYYIIQTIKRLRKNVNHKVLVVDDSVVFRKQMQYTLEAMFFQVTAVAHGEEALAILQDSSEYSLVITDYHMPVMNGLELTQNIRKLYNKNELMVIALSNEQDEDITAQFLKNGANDYIRKPFSKEEFVCRINNSIESIENIHTIINHANRDFLTGLYNRRYFFDFGERYFSEAIENSYSFAVAVLDIDNFKSVNDTYGHDVGDMVIEHLANTLRSTTGRDDIVARFGGEEFCILLKNIEPHQALTVIERAREAVANSELVVSDEISIRYTASFGLATKTYDTLEDYISEADALLYKAKQSGKNKVIAD